MGGGALDHFGLALRVLLALAGMHGIGDLRQPRIEARDRVIQLAGDLRFAARRIVARRLLAGLRNLLDLAGDRIKPLMDVVDRAMLRVEGGLLLTRLVGLTGIGLTGIGLGGNPAGPNRRQWS